MGQKATHLPLIADKYLRTKRRALESLYCGLLTVIVKEKVTDPKTHITDFNDVVTLEDIPCRLCEQNSKPVTTDEPAEAKKSICVILNEKIDIPAGSKLIITQHNRTALYEQSGEPEYKSDTQTIPLEFIEYA